MASFMMKCRNEMSNYIYRGDKITSALYKGKECVAVKRKDGKCIRGKNGNMLVDFDGTLVVVLARQLRKIEKSENF